MIPRYARPEMTAIFSPEEKLRLWLEIELSAAEAMADLGQVPKDAVTALRAATEHEADRIIDPAAVEAIEAVTRHDVIAFLTHLENLCGADTRFLHLGLTSSDLLDTTLAVQLSRAADLLTEGLDRLLAALKARAEEHRSTATIGRSHAIHAEPTSFGVKLAGHYAEIDRCRARLQAARADIATCAISGAVGTFANIDPAVEAAVAARLGLTPEPVSTQVIPRDRHAHFTTVLAIIASAIERLAIEVRHLQRSEVREAEEFFHKGQKGSSAMPHKRNPVLSENLTGLARIVRGAVVPALENVALWHERDISHSAVERTLLPDACIVLDFALHRAAGMIEKLVVYPDRMKRNLDASLGLWNAQRVLLALIETGLPRQRAYELVQKNAMRSWEAERPFLAELQNDPEVVERIDPTRLAGLFDLHYHLKHVDTIFERVFGPAQVAWTTPG
ncbi:MAG TPA: adenylosuccinate lyase [Geminicoccus sp.]|uniref:adenylosuccinate lyase n=1 Tax=Geminicoccus sp. TaxID=2024832 RepID=UPI002E334544|nr:adenylosuccinate lyase [Geminicoccus sp.]HEX2527325.1 adenylosuccinate lyase [Geminicoccus sp.]